MAELGVGYISIVPEVSKISPGIAKALGDTAPVAEKSGQSMGGKLSAGISKTLKGAALGTGAAAGGLIATGLTKGFGRLQAIEGAQSKLTGLGNSAETVAGVMDNALNAVKGTAHGLGEAASVSASLVASGIKPGQELEQTLKTVGDTAAIAGRSMEDVGLIFGSVAARGKLQGDDMLQLMSSGIPVLQLLSEELGVTSAEVSDMVSKGEVDFATFEKAMREGMGGAALEMGDTFSGAVANMGAAAGRVGATALKPFFGLAKDGAGSVTAALDGLNDKLGPVMDSFGSWLTGRGVPALKEFGSSLIALGQSTQAKAVINETKDAVSQLWAAGEKLLPTVVSLMGTLGKASAALGVSAWQIFVSTLQTAGSVLEAVAGPLGSVSDFLAEHPALVTAAVGAWAGFKTVPGVISKITGAFTPQISSIKTMGQGVKDLKAYYADTGREISTFGAAVQLAGTSSNKAISQMARAYESASAPLKAMSAEYKVMGKAAADNAVNATDAFTSIDYMAQSAGRSVQSSVTSMAGTMKGVGAAGFAGLKAGAMSVVDALGGPWGLALTAATIAVGAFVESNAKADEANRAIAVSTKEASEALGTFYAEMAGKAGAMTQVAAEAASKVAEGEMANLMEMGKAMEGYFNINNLYDEADWDFGDLYGQDLKRATDRAASITEQAYGRIKDSLEGVGMTVDDLGAVISKGGEDFDQLVASVNDGSEAGEYAARKLQEARDKIVAMQEAAQQLDPAMAGISDSMGVLADQTSTAEQKLNALKDIMDKLTGGTLSHDEAQAKLVEDVENTTEAITEMAGKLSEVGPIELDPDGTIDATTAAGKEAVNMVSDLANTMLEAASNGVSVDEIFSQQEGNLTALQEALGLTDDEFQGLMESYGLTRELMALPLQMEGADTLQQQISTLETGLSRLEEGKSVQITPPDPAVMVALEEIGFKVETLPNGNVEITSTADVTDEELAGLEDRVNSINDLHATATADLDTTMFEMDAKTAKALGSELDGLEVSASADLTIEKLLQGKDVSMGELQALAAEVPTPKADLNQALLNAGVDDSKAKLADLNSRQAKPTVSVNNEPARRGINDVQSWLGNIKDHVVNIFTHRHDSGSFRGGRFADGGVVGLAHGGTVGAASGYRLPKSGPGTSEVDGFQGVDVQGRPTARVDAGEWVINRRSSERSHNLLSAINQGRISDRDAAVAGLALADGGVVSAKQLLDFASGKNVNGQQASRSLEGAPYVWGGVNWGDCSGAMSALARFATGVSAFAGRFATGSEAAETAALGFKNGLGSGARLALGWFNGGPWGGHTAGTIYDESGNATNVEMGGGRGNGQIGGAAAGAANSQFTNHAYLPLNGGVDIGISDVTGEYDSSPVASTSVDGFTTKSGKSVSWGTAQDFYDKAIAFQKMTRVHDNGGVLRSGMLALNLSGKDERILTHSETRGYERGLDILPKVADKFDSAVSKFVYAASPAQRQTVRFGRSFGGDFLSQAEIVQDAEKGLLETRRAIADEADNVSEKEEALAEARKALAEAEAEGGGLSVQQKRKLEDAEEALAKARESGKPDKIADAEKKLARAREDIDADLAKSKDKNAKKVQDAQKKVNKAEDDLSEAREATRDQSDRLIAAERAVAAARYQAAGEMAQTIFDSFARGAKSVEDFFGEMSKLAEVVDRMREEVSKLEMQQKMNAIERLRSLAELQIREQDVARARARGAVDIAKAEEDLQNARNAAAKLGSTSIEAMSGAMDRFRTTGIFSIEKVSESVVENTAEVKAAEWGVKVARAKAALDEFEATRQQALAQFQVAQATLTQTTAAQMLTLQTSQLKAQAAELYGLTANQASGASRGFGGIGKIGGGIGKVIGGVLAGLAGFAAGGPLGALAGAGMALGGITDIARGSIDIHHNKKEMGEAWKKLDAGSKASLLLGAGGSAALGAAGGALAGKFGPDFAKGMGDLSEQWAGATIGSLQYGISSKIEKLQRDQEDQRKALERKISQMENQLSLDKAKGEVDYLTKKNVLESQLEYAKLKQEAAKATNQGVIDALNAAAKVEAERARVEHSENVKLMNATNDHLSKLVELSRNDAGANAETTRQLADAVDGINKVLLSLSARPMSAASGVQFADTRI